MAKQGVKDIRVDFVEAIGKTENLKTIRSICYDLEKRPMRSRLTQQSINTMLENGYNKIVSLGLYAQYFSRKTRKGNVCTQESENGC